MPSGLLAPTNGTFGAPGVFLAPPEPVREITGVSRSTAAFFGVSPRGPARLPAGTLEPDDDVLSWLTATPVRRTVPRLVTSWDEYRHHFGGFEGPGRLPYAVSAFFAGGGRRAWIGRIVHDYGSDADNGGGRAIGELDGLGVGADRCPIILMARSEGRWGDRLAGSLRLVTRPLTLTEPAIGKLALLLAEEGDPGLALRVAVRPGGCSGFSYEMFFDAETEPDDVVEEFRDGVRIAVDSQSVEMLRGSTLDYKDGLMGAGFAIDNPNVTKSCGCGNSFS